MRWNHAPERLDYYDCHDLQGSALSEHVVKGVGNQLLQEQAKAKLRPKEIVWVYQQVCVCLNHAPLPLQGEGQIPYFFNSTERYCAVLIGSWIW